MTDVLVAVLIGLIAGILSGLFGVGGGIVMTPGIQLLLGTAPIVALATPLPVILPTAIAGALTYRRAGEIDERAALWMSVPGIAAAAVGAALTDVIDTHLLLVVTALLLAYQAFGILRGRRSTEPNTSRIPTKSRRGCARRPRSGATGSDAATSPRGAPGSSVSSRSRRPRPAKPPERLPSAPWAASTTGSRTTTRCRRRTKKPPTSLDRSGTVDSWPERCST